MGGERLEVLLAPSEDELMEVQAKARALGLPTHTFAGGFTPGLRPAALQDLYTFIDGGR